MSIGRSSAVGLATSVAVFGLGIVVTVVLTRSLGAEQRGIYFLLVATNAALAEVTKLGVGVAAEALLARRRLPFRQVHAAAVATAVGAGVVCTLAVSAFFPLLDGNVFRNVRYHDVLVASLLISPTVYHGYWNAMMAGLGRVVLMNKVMLALSIVNAALIICLVGFLDLGLRGFLWAWSITYVAGAVLMSILAARLGGLDLRPSLLTMRTLAAFGVRAHWGAIAQQALTRFDLYTVNVVVGTRAVGQYSLATTLAERLWMPTAALTSSTVATVAQLGKHEAALLTARVVRLSILLMAAMAAPLAIAAPWLLPVVFGRSFTASVTPLAVLLPGATMLGALLVLQNYVVVQLQRPGLFSLIFCADLVVSVPFYLLLISRHGIVGAAVGSTISYTLAFAAVLVVFCRDSGVPVQQVLVPRGDDIGHVLRFLRRPFASATRVPAGDAS